MPIDHNKAMLCQRRYSQYPKFIPVKLRGHIRLDGSSTRAVASGSPKLDGIKDGNCEEQQPDDEAKDYARPIGVTIHGQRTMITCSQGVKEIGESNRTSAAPVKPNVAA